MPETVGPYRIEKLLGAGGMGKVYLAFDQRLDRRVAIKHIRAGVAGNSESRARLRREARAAAGLSHPAIVQVFDILETEDGDWVVMELVDGPTVASLLRDGPLDVRRALAFAGDVANGLAAAHARSLIHRDLKSENVMIGPGDRAKILDFGLVKNLRLQPGEAVLTVAGGLLGTCKAMSPEQAKGLALDLRSDLFSLGSLLYEMVTAEPPFRGASDVATLERVRNYQQPPARDKNPRVPAELSQLIDQLLEKAPERRPPSARIVAHALAAIAAGLDRAAADSESSIPTQLAIGKGIAPRRRKLMVAGLLIALAALGLALVSGAFRDWLFGPREVAGATRAAPADAPDLGPGAEQDAPLLRIVVLPFENLGPEENAYFAAGMTEEITRRLAVLSGLGVISHTSAARYAQSGKTVQEIGRDLGAAYVLEGTVNWPPATEASARIRITPRLIRVADDIHIWTDAYERRPDDTLRVQSEIAGEVVVRLDVALLGPEKQALEGQPTKVPSAYFAYLRGLDYRDQPTYSADGLAKAVSMFERATGEDPGFTEAWAELSRLHSYLFLNIDPTDKRRQAAVTALDRARALADVPAVRLAAAYYSYHVEADYDRAVEEFTAAARLAPNNAEISSGLGYVKRRQGRLEEAARLLEASFELDRANAGLAGNIAQTYRALRRFREADHWFGLDLALARDLPYDLGERALNTMSWQGCPSPPAAMAQCSTASARKLLAESPLRDDPRLQRYWLLLDLYDVNTVPGQQTAAQFAKSLARIEANPAAPRNLIDRLRLFWRQALVYDRLGRRADVSALAEVYRQELEELIAATPDFSFYHSSLGLAYAFLERRDEAIAAGERAVELSSKDRFSGPRDIELFAVILTLVGEHQQAIEQLDNLLATAYDRSITLVQLRLDPVWDPLRGSPRFERMLSSRS